MNDAKSQDQPLGGLFAFLGLAYLLTWAASALWLSHYYVRFIFLGALPTLIFLGFSVGFFIGCVADQRRYVRISSGILIVVWLLLTGRLLFRQFGLEEVARVGDVSVRLATPSPQPGHRVRGEVLVTCRLRCEITSIRFRHGVLRPDTVLASGAGLPSRWAGTADEHNVARKRFLIPFPDPLVADSAVLVVSYQEAESGDLNGLRVAYRETTPIRFLALARQRR